MTRDRQIEQLDALIDAFEASVLEASDEDILATGGGEEAASIVAGAFTARNYRSDRRRPVASRERLRRVAAVSRTSVRNRYDVTKVSARFSSGSEDVAAEEGDDDPDLA